MVISRNLEPILAWWIFIFKLLKSNIELDKIYQSS